MEILEPHKESTKIVYLIGYVPSPAMFSRIHQALRERDIFRRSLREGIHNVGLETEILDEVNRDPETSTRALARQFGVHNSTVCRTINGDGF